MLFKALNKFAFLQKRSGQKPFFASSSQPNEPEGEPIPQLRPFVKISFRGIPVYTVPYEHLIDFTYFCGEGDLGIDSCQITFYDQTFIFVETLIRLAWNQDSGNSKEQPFEVEFGWWSPTGKNITSGKLRMIILEMTYNYNTNGVVINIAGPAAAFKGYSSVKIGTKPNVKFRPNESVKPVQNKNKPAVESKKFDFSKSQAETFLKSQLKQFLKEVLNDETIHLDEGEEYINVEITADLELSSLNKFLRDGVDFTGDETIQQAVESILQKLSTSNKGVLKAHLSSEVKTVEEKNDDGDVIQKRYLNTLYIFETKKVDPVIEEKPTDDETVSYVIPIHYPSHNNSVISFTPTYNAWVSWLAGYRKITFDKNGAMRLNKAEKKPIDIVGNPTKAPIGSYETGTKELDINAEAAAKNFDARLDLVTATATMEILGEPFLVGAENLFNLVFDIKLNTLELGVHLASANFLENFNQNIAVNSKEYKAFDQLTGFKNVGMPISASPFNGKWLLTSFRHNIGAGGFRTTLQLIKIE